MSAEFEIKRRYIKDWLDIVIQTKKKLEYLSNSHHEFGVRLCGEYSEVHMFGGLETIAFYLGQTVIYDPMWGKDKGRMYFMYEGLEVFQLWSKQS